MSQNSFVCTHLNGFKYSYVKIVILFNVNCFKSSKWLNNSIWCIDRALTGTTTPVQSGPGSDGNEGVL